MQGNGRSGPAAKEAVDAVLRRGYWLAYRLLRGWWYLRRPECHGALVAIWLDGRILMVRHSYRRRLGWPGGGMKRGEAAVAAARRELREELGLAVEEAALAYVGEVLELSERRRDHVRIFELMLSASPVLRPDGREVVAADFMPPAQVLSGPLAPVIRNYLLAKAT